MIDKSPESVEAPKSPNQTSRVLPPPFMSPTRSASFKSPSGARPKLAVRAQSFALHGRRMFDVDGTPLPHWDKSNFEPHRDETCRVVFQPKEGIQFFQKILRKEEYDVMRRATIEQPFFSKYNRFYPTRGHFCCKACGNPLYSHHAKLKKFNGWPAFGACVEGAVAMTTVEERKAKTERETIAATQVQAHIRGCLIRAQIRRQSRELIEQAHELQHKIKTAIRLQSFVRGCLSRARVSKQLEKLIDKVLEMQVDDDDYDELMEEELLKDDDEEEPFDVKPPQKKASDTRQRENPFANLSIHSLNDISLFDDSISSAASFMESSFSKEEVDVARKVTSKEDFDISCSNHTIEEEAAPASHWKHNGETTL